MPTRSTHPRPVSCFSATARRRTSETKIATIASGPAHPPSYIQLSPPRSSLLQPARWRTTGSPRGPRRPRPFRLQSTPLLSSLLALLSTAIGTYLPKRLVIKTPAIKTLATKTLAFQELRYLPRPPALQLQNHLMER